MWWYSNGKGATARQHRFIPQCSHLQCLNMLSNNNLRIFFKGKGAEGENTNKILQLNYWWVLFFKEQEKGKQKEASMVYRESSRTARAM